MIRIQFSAADLGRVTFPVEPEPLWQVALAARVMGIGEPTPGSVGVRRWRGVAGKRVRPSMKPLFKLISPTGQFPGFLTFETGPSVTLAVEALMDTPADVMRDELAPYLPSEVHPFMRGLLAGDGGARRALGTAIREFHQHVLGPSAADLGRGHAADLAFRSQTLLTAGTDALLSTLHPQVGWQSPTLTLAGQADFDLHLNGRGLRLQPSPFVTSCLVADEPGQQPTLIYPSLAAADPAEEDAADPLADLLGRTRAAVLRTLSAPASTTQLARRLGISNASVSDHTRVLRSAGLIITHRTRGTAQHCLTPAAHQLLVLGDHQRHGRARDRH